MKRDDKKIDNIEATSNNIDGIDIQYDENDATPLTRVTATMLCDEVSGISNPDGTNTLEGIDNMDSINQMADMDHVASRKGMVDLKDTTDMLNTDEITNVDHLNSSNDIGYTDDANYSYLLRCPHCSYEFTMGNALVREAKQVACPQCATIFESEDGAY